MVRYTAEQLEKDFRHIGRARKNKKGCEGDAGYWDGGRCDYGASHNLTEDCHTLEKAFNKMESLGKMKSVLLQTTSKQEFDNKKRNYLTKCDEVINGLTPNYGAHSSMFGICIIWSNKDTNRHVESKIRETKREIEAVKDSLSKEDYQAVEEIRQLDLEISQIEEGIAKKRTKAMSPNTSPQEKLALLAEVEEDSKKLKQKYAKKKELDKKFNFNFEQHISGMVEAMKKAVKWNDNSGSGGTNRNSKTSKTTKKPKKDDSDDDNNQNNGDSTGGGNSGSNSGSKKDKNKNQPSQQQLLIFAGIALLVIFYLMNQKQEKESNHYLYDF